MTHSFPTRRSADLRGGRHGHRLSAADRERSEQHRDADQDRKERAKAHARSYGRDAAVVQRPILPLARRLKLTPLSLTASLHWREERSEEHTSELQSLMRISYAVFCLKKKQT